MTFKKEGMVETYYQKNRERILARSKKYGRDHKEKISLYHQTLERKFKEYKDNAKKRNIPFDLTIVQFKTFWQVPCIAGCEIATIGIDRICRDIGYTMSNIRPMCRKHNLIKNKYSDEDIIALADALKLRCL